MKKFSYTIGIDEVGRGPLAGPVCVCALALSKEDEKKLKAECKKRKFADSKKLTERQRQEWALWRRRENIPYAIAYVMPKAIDRIRIHNAVDKAAQKAYEKLKVKRGKGGVKVIADGSIKVIAPNFKSFPKADELVPAVSLASIVAKIHRDRYMTRLDKKYGQYDFAANKGYGTRAHTAALVKHGPSKAHRLTFIERYNKVRR